MLAILSEDANAVVMMSEQTELPVLGGEEPMRTTPKTSPQLKSDSVVRCFEGRDCWSLLF